MTSSMKLKSIALAAVAAVFVVIPATASAHPSVYTDVAKTVPTGWTYAGANFAGLDNQTRYVVNNHGYPVVLRESNGVTTGGVMDYKRIPSAYRNALKADLGIQAVMNEAGSAAQAHATCTAAALNTTSAITGWQGADPFYAYIPFENRSANLEDDPATWVDDVQTLTGVDLTTITDTTYAEDGPLDTACEGLGGNLVPPDAVQTTGASYVSAIIADSVAAATGPLNTQITTLTDEKAALEADKTALQADKTALEGQVATLTTEKQSLSDLVASLTGAKNALETEVTKLKTDLAKSKSAHSKALKQIKSLKKQVAKLKKRR